MAWRGACQRAGGGEAAVVFSPPAPTPCVRAGGRLPQANAPILQKSIFFLFCFFIFMAFPFRWWPLWSPTPRRVAPSCTTSWSRSSPWWRTTSTSAAAKPERTSRCRRPPFPADSCLLTHPSVALLGETTPSRGVSLPKCHYCLPKTVRGVKKRRSKRL